MHVRRVIMNDTCCDLEAFCYLGSRLITCANLEMFCCLGSVNLTVLMSGKLIASARRGRILLNPKTLLMPFCVGV